jgi:hypothetical protein
VPFLLPEQRTGWNLIIFCARATRGRRLPSFDARSGRPSRSPRFEKQETVGEKNTKLQPLNAHSQRQSDCSP